MDNTKVIDKMIKELQLAKENEQSQHVLLKHISNVQLLCELFLEDKPVESPSSSFSEQEIKAMLGEKYSQQVEGKEHAPIKQAEANGNSIFDF